MDGVGGYLHDLVGEIAKIGRIFEGRVLTTVGIPILLGGISDPFLVRSLFELEGWLRGSGVPLPSAVMGSGFANHCGMQNQQHPGSSEEQNKSPRLPEIGAGAKSYHLGE